MSGYVEIFVPVSQEYMGIVIGTGGRNIKQLKQETHTRITSCNGDNLGRESGFIVTGTVTDCENVRQAIRRRVDNAPATIKEPVPQQFVRLLTGKHGSDNFREIEKECGVKITWPKFSATEKHVIFDIKGLRSNCERAREMLRANLHHGKYVSWKEQCIMEMHEKLNHGKWRPMKLIQIIAES